MIVFISDAFVEHYVGGAELTTESIIASCLLPNAKVLSQNVSVDFLRENKHHYFIFGNFQNLRHDCVLYAIKNLNYSVLEYDYKYCSFRSPGKHKLSEKSCNCENTNHGKLVSLFLHHSSCLWWMSENQKRSYKDKFSFLNGEVLSSVFSDETLDYIESLNTQHKTDKWIILNSSSWIKGVQEAIHYANKNNLQYELVWGVEYKELLRKMASSKGLIFFPRAGDTCPRMVIEAKLLNCELILNENVQHKDEEWFQTRSSCMKYLRDRTKVFWSKIEKHIKLLPKQNGKSGPKYRIITPFFNAEKYIAKCIDSLKRQTHTDFQCILVDDMSTDGSFAKAKECIGDDSRFVIYKTNEKKYALQNIVEAIDFCETDPEDVVILLDGDDWFASSLTLEHLNSLYEKQDCWMTYGSYIMHPYGIIGTEPSVYPKHIVENNEYRQDKWRASHLRTFKNHLWASLDRNDLKDESGNYYKMTYDQAIMLPLLEMASERHEYVNEILHVYNKENPLNVDKIRAQEQTRIAKEIRSKKPYQRV